MSYLTQKTIKNEVYFSGVACTVHNVKICIKPADPDHGIVFKRIDLTKQSSVSKFMNVTNTSLNTNRKRLWGKDIYN